MMYNKNKKHGENMTHRETAMNNFLKGYNCAQAVLIAYCEELGLDKDTAAMLSCSFGGGMGRLREVCGAVSGMFLVAGFKKGYSDPKDKEAKKKHYELVQLLAKEFKDIHGSIVCRELLGLNIKGADNPTPEDRTAEYYKKRPCVQIIGDAAEIVERVLFQES